MYPMLNPYALYGQNMDWSRLLQFIMSRMGGQAQGPQGVPFVGPKAPTTAPISPMGGTPATWLQQPPIQPPQTWGGPKPQESGSSRYVGATGTPQTWGGITKPPSGTTSRYLSGGMTPPPGPAADLIVGPIAQTMWGGGGRPTYPTQVYNPFV